MTGVGASAREGLIAAQPCTTAPSTLQSGHPGLTQSDEPPQNPGRSTVRVRSERSATAKVSQVIMVALQSWT